MRVLAYILFVFFIVPSTIKVGYMVDYAVQYDVYATELCENQDQPDLKCNGKCQLMKNMEGVDPLTSEPPETPSLSFLEQIIIFDTQDFSSLSMDIALEKESGAIHWTNFYDFNYLSNIDHPPKYIF